MPVIVAVAGSVVGGWKGAVLFEMGLVAAARPGETMAGDGMSAIRGPRARSLPGKERGMSVWKVCQVSEAEPGFLEIGDAS